MGAVEIVAADTAVVTVTPTATCRPNWLNRAGSCATGTAHLILAVTDEGSPRLTSYRRVILNIRAAGR